MKICACAIFYAFSKSVQEDTPVVSPMSQGLSEEPQNSAEGEVKWCLVGVCIPDKGFTEKVSPKYEFSGENFWRCSKSNFPGDF